MRIVSLVALIANTIPTALVAAPAKPDGVSKLATNSVGTGVVLEMVAVLIAVIILILGLGWLIKRVGNFPTAGKGMVKILGGVSLGPRERAVVLEAGNRRLLVGVAPGRVQTLCILGDADTDHTEDLLTEFSDHLGSQMQDEPK